MPAKLTTTINKIQIVPNPSNAEIISEFYHYMKGSDVSENHQNNCLKVVLALANFLGTDITFYDIKNKEQITAFLDTKVKSREEDPDKKWITTWNHYLNRVRLFFRWFYNARGKDSSENILSSEWETPAFVKIKGRKTKRLSPYLETELWDRDEILFIVRYELHIRNKAALTLFWDLGARNHEVTLLKIKHIRLRERYGEGEIPHEAKTGGGPVLLTCSFPYVRDWLNKHPFRNEPNARLICNIMTGAPVNPEAMWTMMKELRLRIIRMLEDGSVINDDEGQKLQYLLKTKKWNPYCIRHSSITSDSDYLTEYALKKKARWSMNSRQGTRYIKRRMGNDLKRQILVHNGVLTEEEIQKRPSVMFCPRCSLVIAFDNKYCSKCSYPLIRSAFDEIKAGEDIKLQALKDRYEQEMRTMREEIQKDMKHQIYSIEQAQKETKKQLEELLKYRSKTMGMLMRTT
jgi:integrase/recombinase XerD